MTRYKLLSCSGPFSTFSWFVDTGLSLPMFKEFGQKVRQMCREFGCSWHCPDRTFSNFLYRLAVDNEYQHDKVMFSFLDLLHTESLTTYAYTFTERFAEANTFSGDDVSLESMIMASMGWSTFESRLHDDYDTPKAPFSFELGWRAPGDTELELPVTPGMKTVMALVAPFE